MMNRYFVERFQQIEDALPSASRDSLVAIRDELERLAAEVEARLGNEPADTAATRRLRPVNGNKTQLG